MKPLQKEMRGKREVMPWRAVSANIHIVLDLFLSIFLSLSVLLSFSLHCDLWARQIIIAWFYEVHESSRMIKYELKYYKVYRLKYRYIATKPYNVIIYIYNKLMMLIKISYY